MGDNAYFNEEANHSIDNSNAGFELGVFELDREILAMQGIDNCDRLRVEEACVRPVKKSHLERPDRKLRIQVLFAGYIYSISQLR